MKPKDYPRVITCPYCDGQGHNEQANTECGFCNKGRLTVVRPFLGGTDD
jgi:hypothetical protein